MKSLPALFLLGAVSVGQAAGQGTQPHNHADHAHEKLGKVNFPVSCAGGVQAQFSRAVALLHSFQYEEAEQGFRQIAQADPSCAMAYWGIAMSTYHPLWVPPSKEELAKGAAAVEKARAIGAGTEREKAYIEAIGAFYRDHDKLDHRARALAYEGAMEQLQARFKDDSEAAIFYALALNSTALPTDKTFANQKKAVAILNTVFARQPEHPGIAHYIIHNFDTPQLAELALPAARAYSKIAPDSAHALHMPSHIFTRLALWNDSIQSNLASRAAARRYAGRAFPGRVHWEELHAMDYLAYAYLQLGRDTDAEAVAAEAKKVEKLSLENFAAAYAYAAIPARFALERRDWKEAAKLSPQPSSFPWDKFGFAEAIFHYANALGAARLHDPAQAHRAIERMRELHRKLVDSRDGYWSGQTEVLLKTALAWTVLSEGKNDEALNLMQSAADMEDSTEKHPVTPGAIQPARELLGEMLLQLQRPAEALAAFEKSLANNRDRFNGIYGAARASRLAGNDAKARQYYARLSSQAQAASRPEVREAREFLSGRAGR